MDFKNVVLFLVPRVFKNLTPILATFATSLLPFTVFNFCLYLLTVIIVYMTNFFGFASKLQCGCKDNKPVQGTSKSLWQAFTRSYWLYLPAALLVNYSVLKP